MNQLNNEQQKARLKKMQGLFVADVEYLVLPFVNGWNVMQKRA